MYAGRVVETGSVTEVLGQPLHPYTRGLLSCVPSLTTDLDRLVAIPGTLPEPSRRPAGCRFSPRCPEATAACGTAIPPLVRYGDKHAAACIRIDGAAA